MQMWIMFQSLVPGMQHHQRCRLTAQFFTQDFAQRVPGRAKQQPIRRASIAQHQARQLLGKREHDLEVVDLRQ